MKKELKKIKSLINQTPKYQNIESKLDFNDFNDEPVQKVNHHHWLKIFIPVASISLATIIAVSIPMINPKQIIVTSFFV